MTFIEFVRKHFPTTLDGSAFLVEDATRVLRVQAEAFGTTIDGDIIHHVSRPDDDAADAGVLWRHVALVPRSILGDGPADWPSEDAWLDGVYRTAGFGWPIGNLGVEGNPGRPFAFPASITLTGSGRYWRVEQTCALDI